MVKQKAVRRRVGQLRLARFRSAVGVKLTEAEEDLLWHVERGYQLETDSLGGEPVLAQLET
jgi:hypothetical protein